MSELIPEGFKQLRVTDDFVGLIGPLWFKAEGDKLRVGLPLEPRHGNPMGWAHGGLLVTVADMVMGAGSGYSTGIMWPHPTVSLSTEFVKGAKLGVRLQAVTPEMARQLKIEGEGGVLVAEVSPDGAAARAGLQRGDVILEVAQEAVSKPEQVSAAVSKAKPGDVLLLRVKRGNMATYLPVKIPEPEAPEKADKKK